VKTYLLDNNVLSELWKQSPDPRVEAWFASKPEWFLPVPVIAEIQEGAEATGSATRRAQINAKLDELLRLHSALVLPWDAETARTWGRLKHSPKVKPQPQPLWDSLIDAMAVRYGAVVATRNKGGFRHADTFSPWGYPLKD
jgi:predicted nucleic acid-binding protein